MPNASSNSSPTVLLVTGKELLRREPDGSMVRHADLSGISGFGRIME